MTKDDLAVRLALKRSRLAKISGGVRVSRRQFVTGRNGAIRRVVALVQQAGGPDSVVWILAAGAALDLQLEVIVQRSVTPKSTVVKMWMEEFLTLISH